MSHFCEKDIENQLTSVGKQKTKNEKLAWQRKLKKMEGLIAELEPLQEAILAIMDKKQPILDDITLLRNEMIKECVHPRDYLIHKGSHIECKFCSARLSIPSTLEAEVTPESESEDE